MINWENMFNYEPQTTHAERRYIHDTKDWSQKKWRKEMNINKVKVGDFVEGMWFPDGYFYGKVEMIGRKKGFLTQDNTIAFLSDAHGFRVRRR